MMKSRNETEEVLLSVTKNSQTLINQTQTEPQERLNINLPNQEKLSHLNHQSQLTDLG